MCKRGLKLLRVLMLRCPATRGTDVQIRLYGAWVTLCETGAWCRSCTHVQNHSSYSPRTQTQTCRQHKHITHTEHSWDPSGTILHVQDGQTAELSGRLMYTSQEKDRNPNGCLSFISGNAEYDSIVMVNNAATRELNDFKPAIFMSEKRPEK